MLQFKLKTLDGLSDEHKALYVEKDGEFILQVEGIDDAAEVKRARDHEREARKAAQEELATTRAALEEKQNELDDMRRGAIPKNDVEALEASWKAKYEKLEKEAGEKIAAASGTLETLLVDNVANQLAQEISTAPKVILPHIRGRLRTETVDGKTVTRVLDAAGNPSALTVDELKKELIANEEFSAIIVGSKATGGGAAPKPSGGGAGAGKAPDLANTDPKGIAEYLKNKNGGQ